MKRKQEELPTDSAAEGTVKKVKMTNELMETDSPSLRKSFPKATKVGTSLIDDDESKTKSAVKQTTFGKTSIKYESKRKGKKGSSKSKPDRKIERKAKAIKSYKEDEIQVTGSRNLVEVYDDCFGEELVDDESHRSIENKGKCTLIKEASILLLGICPNLSGVFGKVNCDDRHLIVLFLFVLTS